MRWRRRRSGSRRSTPRSSPWKTSATRPPRRWATLAQGSDPAFEDALSALAAGLGREDIQTLLAEARRTRTGQDDTIVAQIDDARARIKDEDVETREQKERLKTLAARRRELEDIQWEFKKQRFDDPRSSFGEERLVGDLLNDFLRGGISAASYWEQWRRSQNWSAGTSEWGGGIGLPNNGRERQSLAGSRRRLQWPDNSFGGGSSGRAKSNGGFGGGWARPSSGSSRRVFPAAHRHAGHAQAFGVQDGRRVLGDYSTYRRPRLDPRASDRPPNPLEVQITPSPLTGRARVGVADVTIGSRQLPQFTSAVAINSQTLPSLSSK